LSPDDDEDFQPLLDIIDNLKDTVGDPRQLSNFSPKSFLPRDKAGYYRYQGSLTTPGCNEGVIWTIFTHTLPISKRQVLQALALSCTQTDEQFNLQVKIFEALQTEEQVPLTKNYRSLQPLNGRTLYLKVSPIRSNGFSPKEAWWIILTLTTMSVSFKMWW